MAMKVEIGMRPGEIDVGKEAVGATGDVDWKKVDKLIVEADDEALTKEFGKSKDELLKQFKKDYGNLITEAGAIEDVVEEEAPADYDAMAEKILKEKKDAVNEY